ncbi:MAG: hypothetical protein H5T81_11735 [Tetrasphaera sp.]|nr:hypothetical protein [Tetrasphaera sp.]
MTRWRLHVVLALSCAVVNAALMTGKGPARYVVSAVLAVALLAAAPAPWIGPVVAAAAQLAATAMGVPVENPGPLLAIIAVAYLSGRGAATTLGLSGVGVLILVSAAVDGFAVGTTLFSAVFIGGVWCFGWIVRRRAESAERAGAEAARLAAEDPAVVAHQVVTAERERLAAETIGLIREAVLDMQATAREASPDLDPARLAAVQARGSEVVADLRRLLGLLRSDPAPEPPSQPAHTPSWPGPRDWVPTAAALALLLLDRLYTDEPALLPWVVAGGFALVPLLQRRLPFVAALAVGGLPLLALLLGVPFIAGFSLLVVVATVGWHVGATLDRFLGPGLGVLLAARLWVVATSEPENIPIEIAVVVLPVVAGLAWHDRDRAFRRAREQAGELLGVRETAIAEAVTAERLRIARELHDVSSHAVGVMVLQAGAAAAQRSADPDRARAALGALDTAASQAVAELDALARTLSSGRDVGPWVGSAEDLAAALTGLVDRMRGAGLAIELELQSLPADERVAAAVYRTVQEALTNAARHAPGATVRVEVSRRGGVVEVEVVDSGGGADTSGGSGFGLDGLAERVRALGGDFGAGPRPEGGFAVRARIPDITSTRVSEVPS